MRRLKRLALTVLALAACDQLVQWTVLRDGELLGVRIAPFDPPLFDDVQVSRVRAFEAHAQGGRLPANLVLDPDLGWRPAPESSSGPFGYDWAGARQSRVPLARERAADERRVVAVGCSFTRGDEVGGEECWAGLIQDDPAAPELANLGMGAYGADQAWLRYLLDGRPLEADAVWLVWVPSTSLRLLTRYPPLQKHWSGVVAFKPRFALRPDGALDLLPCPAGDPASVARLLASSRALRDALLPGEHWIERAPLAYADAGSHPLHASALGRAWLTWREGQGRDAHAALADGDGELAPLLRALFERAARDAARERVELRVIVLPARDDLAAARHGARPWTAITAELEHVVDLTDALLAAGLLEDDAAWAPGGHPSPRGHAVIARELLLQNAR